MRELTTIKWGPSLRESTGWQPVETSLSTCWGQVVSLFPEVPAVMFPARKFACQSIRLFFKSIRSGMWQWNRVNVPLVLLIFHWKPAVCVTAFRGFHSLGDFYFITIIFFPSRSQNAICHPTVTGTPHKDGLFVSNSMNPWQRCQAMLNAAPIFHASPPSLSPPAEC